MKMFNDTNPSWFDLICSFVGGIIGGPIAYRMIHNNIGWFIVVPAFIGWCLFWAIFAVVIDSRLDKGGNK